MKYLKKFKPIKLSNPAEADLQNIADYTLKEWGKLQKVFYLNLFKQSFLSLSQNHEAHGLLIKNRDDIDAGLQSYGIKNHIVYFRETKTELMIIRILHSRMDPEKNIILRVR